MRTALSSAVVLCVAPPAIAQLGIKPQTPTPQPLIREAFMPKREVLLSYPMPWKSAGKPIWLWKYHKRRLADLLVTNAQGKELTDEEVRTVLKQPTMVLLSADGKPVHKYYLSVMKPDTLVIIDNSPKPDPKKKKAGG